MIDKIKAEIKKFEKRLDGYTQKQKDYNLHRVDGLKRALKWAEETKEKLIEWGGNERKNNNIFRKSVDDLNEDWISKIIEEFGEVAGKT